jgi:hypothetical protein
MNTVQGRSPQIVPLPWWEGIEGRGWFDELTMITLSMSKGHPHLYPVE